MQTVDKAESLEESERAYLRVHLLYWLGVLAAIVLAALAFRTGLDRLLERWIDEEEYSHGFLLLAVSGYFLWQKLPALLAEDWKPGWHGPALVLLSAIAYLVAEFSAIYAGVQYAAVLFLVGLAVTVVGVRPARHLFAPLALLFLSIPLPWDIQAELTAKLQLLSSRVGVAIVEAMGIPVFLEGNVIDLGTYRLQVVEACSGLRYLFPLASLGFICACLFRVALWKRVVLVLSTIPITILMNSIRIGIAGVLVDRYGIEMAEGFIHDFEGWSIFAACLAILFLIVCLLARVGRDRAPVLQVFGLETTPALPESRPRPTPAPLVISLAIIALTAAIGNFVAGREEIVPERRSLLMFPTELDGRHAQAFPIEDEVLELLQMDDYLLADYQLAGSLPVNLYVAWYASQRMGAAPHSPRVCIPGGGWEITQFSRETFPFTTGERPLHYNRAVVSKGGERLLVYYWFQGRGRTIANEYAAKWYLLLDALRMNRSDGALVRLTTPLEAVEPEENAERRLTEFAYKLLPELRAHVPE